MLTHVVLGRPVCDLQGCRTEGLSAHLAVAQMFWVFTMWASPGASFLRTGSLHYSMMSVLYK